MAGLLRLGQFTFQPTGPSYEAISEAYKYKWSDQEILQAPNRLYWGGKQEQTMDIKGSLYMDLTMPRYNNGIVNALTTSFAAVASVLNSWTTLDSMAKSGNSFPLVDVTGKNYGHYVILEFTVEKSIFWFDAIARKQSFDLKLKKDLQSDPEEKKDGQFADMVDLSIIKVRDIINNG